DAGHELRIHAELENRAGTRLRGELRVDHLVGPVAEPARDVHPAEEIRASVPALVTERRLVDERRPFPHRAARALEAFRLRELRDAEHLDAFRLSKMLEIRDLVGNAALAQDRRNRVVPLRLLRPPL